MNARTLHDWNAADHAIQILGDTHITPDQMSRIFQLTVKRYLMSKENLSLLINELALQTNRMADAGWWGMDCVAAGLEEAAGCLPDVRGPGHEQRDREEEEHQRDMRRFMEAGAR